MPSSPPFGNVLDRLRKGYEEAMNWGMITYQVPNRVFRGTANGQPLCYAALAAQKNYYSLYLMSLYVNPSELAAFRAAFKAAGKKLDTGKSCVRFRRLEDLDLPAVAHLVAATWLEDFVKVFERSRAGGAGRAGEAGRERPRPSRAEDKQIRGEGSASVRAGGGPRRQ